MQSSVSTLAHGRSLLRMEGTFEPAWMANLCAGLATARVSIERATATRRADGSWQAELELLGPSWLELGSLPFAQLADTRREVERGGLQLRQFEMELTEEHGGSLRLRVDADDSLGFLGRMLGSLAMLSLFPVSLRIETRHGRAHDTFWLCGVGRLPPTDQTRQALERALRAAVQAPTSR